MEDIDGIVCSTRRIRFRGIRFEVTKDRRLVERRNGNLISTGIHDVDLLFAHNAVLAIFYSNYNKMKYTNNGYTWKSANRNKESSATLFNIISREFW